jgi:acyl-CoA-binding protein
MDFQAATLYVKSLKSKALTDEQKLIFYALFKQATVGPWTPSYPKPGWLDFVGQAKYNAWVRLGPMTCAEAMATYIETLNKLFPNWRDGDEGNSSDSSGGSQSGGAMNAVSTVKVHISDQISPDSTDPFDCVQRNDIAGVYGALESRFDANFVDEGGASLLHWASDGDHVDLITTLLVKYSAKVDIRDNMGQTPLHYAAICENLNAARVLLQHGASLHGCPDLEGLDPADLCGVDFLKQIQ